MPDDTALPAIPAQRTGSDPVERWLPVVGWEGVYEVSDRGRVRSITRITAQGRRLPGRVLAQHPAARPGRKGVPYWVVCLCRDGQQRTRHVHQLVAEAFIGPRPEGFVVRHGDGNCQNNVPSNLGYGTYSENCMDLVRHGTHRNARKTHCIRGHEFTPENTYLPPSRGGRSRKCLTCARDKRRDQYRARSVAD